MKTRTRPVRPVGLRRTATALGLAAALVAGLLVAQVVTASAVTPVPPANVWVAASTAGGLVPVSLGGSSAGSSVAVDSPHFAAITPDGTIGLVSESNAGKVAAVDLTSGAVVTEVSVGSKPEGIAITPDGTKALVAVSGASQVVPISLSGTTLVVGAAILTGIDPFGIAITPNGRTAYVTDAGTNTVTPIDIASSTAGAPIPVGLNPQGIAVSPGGQTVYVVNSGSGSVTPIATSNNVPGTPISVGSSSPPTGPSSNAPGQIAITPSGASAYVTNAAAGTLVVLDLTTNRRTTDIAIPDNPPTGVAISPDGSTAYVTSFLGNSLTPVSTSTNAPGTTITGFGGAMGVAITPDQAPVAQLAANVTTIAQGDTVTFDASGSTVAYGTITAYQFKFGDGAETVSTTPTATHTYTRPGTFQAQVWEVDTAGTSFQSVFTGQTMSRNSPRRNGLPQDAATVVISVSGPPIPAQTPVLFVNNLNGGRITPVAIPPGGSPGVSTPVPAGNGPSFTAVSPDSRALVVSDFYGNSVTPIAMCPGPSGPTLMPGTTVPAGKSPGQVAIAPAPISQTATQTQWNAYVVESGSNDVRRFVLTVTTSPCGASLTTPVQISASMVPSVVAVGTSPYGIAITPDGKTAYVSNAMADSVTPINLSTATAGTPIPVGVKPQGIAITPNGKTVYVVNGGSGSVTPIATDRNLPGAPISVGTNPVLIAITPDGATAYVTNSGLPPSVTPIVLATNAAQTAIALPAGSSPTGVVVSPDGATAYVASYSNSVVFRVNVATNQLFGDPILGFVNPVGLAITPDQAPVARLSASATTVSAGTLVTFDASASTVAYGTIAKYQFNFGDGSPSVVTTSPTVTHTYANAGTYPVTVFEVSSTGTGLASSFTGQTYSRYAPKQANGVPQDEAGVYVTVTAGATGLPSNTPVLYVSNFGADTLTPVAIPTSGAPQVGAPIATGDGPAFSTATPDGRALVVSNFNANTATPVAVCSNGSSVQYVTGTAEITGTKPSQVAIDPQPINDPSTPDQKWNVYIADSGDNDIRHFILTVSASTCGASLTAVLPPGQASIIPVGASPYGVAISGTTAFVSNTGSATVTPIDLTTGQPGLPIPVGQSPKGIAVTPDGSTVLVANSGSGTVTPIDVVTKRPGTPITVGTTPVVIAITPDSTTAFVTNTGSNSVSQIDIGGLRVVRTVSLHSSATAVAISPDGATAWVTSYSAASLIPISVATGQIGSNGITGLQQPVGVSSSTTP